MKKIKFNKKTFLIFILILSIGTTLAYFTSSVSIPNIFLSSKYETTTTEQFTSPSDWTPGDTIPKTVITTNNSNMPIRVRISVEESWTDNNDNDLNLEENGIKAAVLDLDNRPDWIYEDGYYYYRYDVLPNESTNSFIKSVTFNKDIVGEYVCVTENNVEQCDSASDTYQDANYKLEIKVETTQANNYMDAWGLEHTPRRVDPTYCTYDGDLEVGTEYVNGQYTYLYMKEKGNESGWEDIGEPGWSVYLTDKTSTDPVTTPICTYINDIPILSTFSMFFNSKATSIDLSSLDTREIKSMEKMFYRTQKAKIDVSNFDTSNVTNMSGTFYSANGDGLDVSSFDTGNVTNMNSMFSTLHNNPYLDITHFNTGKVTDMSYLVSGFNGKIDGIDTVNTENVTSMKGMFNNYKLDKIDLSNYDTSKVTDMSYMFNGYTGELIGFNTFNTSNVTNMGRMFAQSDIKNFDVKYLNTSKVTDMSHMFYISKYTSLDVSNFDTSNVESMEWMFYKSDLNNIDISNWDTSNVTKMNGMFSGCTNLEEIIGIEDLDTSKVDNFAFMFYGTKLKRLDLKKWNTQSLSGTGLDTMFRDSSELEYIDVRNFDTSGATSYEGMFCNDSNLAYLNISNFDSQNVDVFYYFTVNAYKIKELDFSSLKTDKVRNMGYIFHRCYELEKIYISDLWTTANVTYGPYMFHQNYKLTGEINNRYTMKPRINELALSDTSTRTIHVGESITIPSVTATYTDSSVVVKNSEDLIWKSSDLDVAKANIGVVKGIAPGNATITIKSGIVETTFNVNVIE